MAILVHLMVLTTLYIGTSHEHYTSVGHLPVGIKDDLISILKGTFQSGSKAPCSPPQAMDIQFLLYTQNSTINPTILNATDPIELDPSKKTVLVAHGWISGPTYIGIPELKDAYLDHYDCNLIIVDWSKIAWQPYRKSHCQLPGVGQIVANFLCLLQEQLNLSMDKIHVIGHSMGGQLGGFIGQHTLRTCGKELGRITGLDPAGHLYQGFPISERLDDSDARLVDVIHTNEFMSGYGGNCGDVDFHVNCGIYQRGCPDFNISNIENTLVAAVICSHVRSLYYMAESVDSDYFKAKSCESCPLSCVSDSADASYITMGENCPPNPAKRNYWVPTEGSSPYAAGCSPFPIECH